MLPKLMNEELAKIFSKEEWEKRQIPRENYCFIELNHEKDKVLIEKLGIQVDSFGPHKVIFMWENNSSIEIGGYLVVDNLSMGKPSLGGTRFTQTVSPQEIASLARGMTLKNSAADIPFGGGKSGIIKPKNIKPEQRKQIIKHFAKMLQNYIDIYNPGPDVGTNDEDMKTFAIYNGLNNVVSKTVDMGGNRIDILGAAAGGAVVALDEIFSKFYKLRELPQFKKHPLITLDQATLLVQGFGAVGYNVAKLLAEKKLLEKTKNPPKIIGVSDKDGYILSKEGFDSYELLRLKTEDHVVSTTYYENKKEDKNFKFCNVPGDMLKESADVLIPATPVPNYVGIEEKFNPSITIDQAGSWKIIIEAANTLSVEEERIKEREKLEEILFHKRGVFIATDYLVNSGGVIFAAFEKLQPTPKELEIPLEIRGDKEKVQEWLDSHKKEFAELAKQRRELAEKKRDSVIRENLTMFIENLVNSPESLPSQVAKQISLERIIYKSRFVKDVMLKDFKTASENMLVSQAAQILVKENMDFLPVVDENNYLKGILTDWDITKFVTSDFDRNTPIRDIMTSNENTITVSVNDSILSTVKLLDDNKVSAVPVLNEEDKVTGIITTDILVHKSLLPLLKY